MALCPALWMGLSRRRRWDGARWTAAAARAAPLCLGGRRLGLRATGAPKRVRLLRGGVAAGVQTPSGRRGMRSHGRPLCTGPSPGGGGPDSDSHIAST